MSTKDIRPSLEHTSCDICGRTLLRGERPEVYVAGSERRLVCDLCTTRALQEGWLREGEVPEDDGGEDAGDRRRSLFGWLRGKRGGRDVVREAETNGPEMLDEPPLAPEPAIAAPPKRERGPVREPRHVRAVPSSVEHKVAAAIEVFNESAHPRTIAGVARSLGSPAVCVRASAASPSAVSVLAAWELCWYRYEIDLADEPPQVRLAAQGSELAELGPDELQANASADQDGMLAARDA